MADLDLDTAEGRTRVFAQLHDARPLLIDLGAVGRFDGAPWRPRVRLVDAAPIGSCDLPLIGRVELPSAVLVRPDGHVAWVGDDVDDPALGEAMAAWFGASRPEPATGSQHG